MRTGKNFFLSVFFLSDKESGRTMDVLKNALKCCECRQTLSQPVTLPCGHTICKRHMEEGGEQVICSECGTNYANYEFVVNKALDDLVRANLIDNIDLGPVHKQCSEACGHMRDQLDKNLFMLEDVDFFIHETIDELKNKMSIKSERIKLRVEEITQEMLQDLDDVESEFKQKREEKSEIFRVFLSDFQSKTMEAEDCWMKWTNILNQLKVDETKWKQIDAECNDMIGEMRANLENARQILLLGKFNKKKLLVEKFTNIDVDQVFNVIYFLSMNFNFFFFKEDKNSDFYF